MYISYIILICMLYNKKVFEKMEKEGKCHEKMPRLISEGIFPL